MELRDESPELAAWVERTAGGTIKAARRQGRWRTQWFVDVDVDGEVQQFVVRMPRDAPVEVGHFESRFSTEHEAAALRALGPTNVPVPPCRGYDETSRSILLELVAGTSELEELEDPVTRVEVFREYVDHLVDLHELDTADLDVPFPPGHPSWDSPVANQFAFMDADYVAARSLVTPEPLLEFGRWWLRTNAPPTDRKLSLVQGDTGSGQFMFDEGRVTALIDWELAHLGDPMLDLGFMRVRETVYPYSGDIRGHVEHYARRASEYEPSVLQYYTVIAALMTPLGLPQLVQAPTGLTAITIPALGWDVTYRRALCEALLESIDAPLEPPEIPDPPQAPPGDLHDFLVEYLETTCLTASVDEWAQYCIRGAAGVAATVRVSDALSATMRADDLADMARVLPTSPGSYAEGMQQLMVTVEDDPASLVETLPWLFYRIQVRREALLRPMMIAQGSEPLQRLASPA